MHTIIQWLLDTIGAMGYPGIFLLMAMESSVIPVPSELVMPPAGYLAFQGKMSMGVAILCGTFGSLVGAYANYLVSHYLGRPLILKYGRYVLIPPHKFERVEQFFLRHGEISTFIGRLLPVVRLLIHLGDGFAGVGGKLQMRITANDFLEGFAGLVVLLQVLLVEEETRFSCPVDNRQIFVSLPVLLMKDMVGQGAQG